MPQVLTPKITAFEFVPRELACDRVKTLQEFLTHGARNRFLVAKPEEAAVPIGPPELTLPGEFLPHLDPTTCIAESEMSITLINNAEIHGPGFLPFFSRSLAYGSVYRGEQALQHDPDLARLFYHPVTLQMNEDPCGLAIKIYPRIEPEITIDFCAVLLAQVGWDNYYHWICEILPRLWYRDYYEELRDLPILVPANLPTFAIESFELLGIPLSQLIPLTPKSIAVKELLIPSMMANECASTQMISFLRKKLHGSSSLSTLKRRIYISRRDASTRKVSNEAEVMQLLKPLGFEEVVLSNLSLKDQVELFSSAELVIGPHGAGITNLVFCPPGSKLIEFMPRAISSRLYYLLCKKAGIAYGCLMVDEDANSFRVDIIKLRELVMRAS